MKILTINGSGTGGYRSLIFCSFLEKELGKPLHEVFDLIAGVSSGSIVGGMLANGSSATDALTQFEETIPVIFSNPRNLLFRLFTTKYKSDNLHEAIKKHFDFYLGDMKTKFMTYAMSLDGDIIKPRHWKSWDEHDANIKAYDPIIASSSAPSYFPPHCFEDNNNGVKEKRSFSDGGTVANNPSMSALAESVTLGESIEDVVIINVGSGKQKGMNPEKFKGLISIAQRLPFAILGSTERIDEYQINALIGGACVNCYPDYMTETDSQDFDEFNRQAKLMWETKKDVIIKKLIT